HNAKAPSVPGVEFDPVARSYGELQALSAHIVAAEAKVTATTSRSFSLNAVAINDDTNDIFVLATGDLTTAASYINSSYGAPFSVIYGGSIVEANQYTNYPPAKSGLEII